jgi:sortase B
MDRKKIQRIIEVVLLAAALILGGSAINDYYQAYKQTQLNEELRQQIEEQVDLLARQEPAEEQVSAPANIFLLEPLRAVNQETVAWLDVDGTKIQYPVVQTADNDYYLRYTFQRERSILGAIFMDFRNNPMLQDFNTVIYGHTNRGSEEMFGSMKLLRDQDYWQDNHTVTVMLDDRYYKYEIFSVYATEADFDYRTPNYRRPEDAERFLREIQERSEIKSDVVPTPDDKILTLSTCTFEFNDARLALHAVLVEERDAENKLVMYNDRK